MHVLFLQTSSISFLPLNFCNRVAQYSNYAKSIRRSIISNARLNNMIFNSCLRLSGVMKVWVSIEKYIYTRTRIIIMQIYGRGAMEHRTSHNAFTARKAIEHLRFEDSKSETICILGMLISNRRLERDFVETGTEGGRGEHPFCPRKAHERSG